MSAGRQAWGGVRRLADQTPLRVRLVLAMVAVLAGTLVLVGAATTSALHRYLMEPVDTQLGSMSDQARPQIARGESEFTISRRSTGGLQEPDRYLTETLDASGQAYYSDPTPLPEDAPDLRYADLSTVDAFTVPALNGGTRWRVLSIATPDSRHVILAADLSPVDSVVSKLVFFMVVLGAVMLALAAGTALLLVRVSLRPLVAIERTTGAIAAGDLSRRAPEAGPGTEVGRLGHAFNVMLERIEQAFAAQAASEAAAHDSEARALRSEDRMRRFIADASHELRTPLTTIRGFAELYRQAGAPQPPTESSPTASSPTASSPTASSPAAPPAVPARATMDSAAILRRIEDEAARMGLLVEDLLLLARLDQQRPLAAEPVDLVVLAADAVEAARVRAPARSVELELSRAPLVVTGDEDRLRQVIGNLLGNALSHTPPQARVTLRLARTPGHAMVEVADTGPGLTAEQAQRVFERFYRADPARTHRAVPARAGGADLARDGADPARAERGGPKSTGLGLAIVAAIVAAHHGEVQLETAPGAGATFRVLLPLAPQPPLAEPTFAELTPAEPPFAEPALAEPGLAEPGPVEPAVSLAGPDSAGFGARAGGSQAGQDD
ncbi:MAG: HAMP domain-containing histidine kinase [Micromonosporaceae bacterium]|nr:HAMP domain-containing histidine kinase [Micromonosporaceae bacterium]